MQTLQRALRRPKDPDKESRHATAVAIASLTTILDTHEVKEKDKLPEWDKLSRQMVEQLKQTADAVKSRKPMDAQARFKAARATCVECHRQFKKEY
jgi:cytochrome c556